MWEDLPKRTSRGTKILITIIIVLVVATLFYVGFTLFKSSTPVESTEKILTPIPSSSTKISSSPIASPTPVISPSPSPNAGDLKVPAGETLVSATAGDTNGDGKDETLVITKMPGGVYHLYVLSSSGTSLFDNKQQTRNPIRIALQTYDSTRETYLSWMLVFTEQSGDLSFVHWNGTAYELIASQ